MTYIFRDPTFKEDYYSFIRRSKTILSDRLTIANDNGEIVCAVGDSITEGSDWDGVFLNRYPGIVQSANMGVSGNTSKETLGRLSTIRSTYASIYLIAIGVNDIRHNNSTGALTVEDFITTMDALIKGLKVHGADIFVLGIWPVFRKDQYPLTTNVFGTVEETNAEIDRRNKALKQRCAELRVPFIDVNTYIRSQINTPELEDDCVPDGIHPNTVQGITIYADAVLN